MITRSIPGNKTFFGLSGFGFECRYCHLNFRYGACFEHWVSLTFRQTVEWIPSKTRTRQDNNTQLWIMFCLYWEVYVLMIDLVSFLKKDLHWLCV